MNPSPLALRFATGLFFLLAPAAIAASCAAGDENPATSSGATSGAGGGSTSTTAGSGGETASTVASTSSGMGGDDFDGGSGSDAEACAQFTAEAEQAPAAMLVVLDASASMNQNQKWSTAQLAIVSAIDKDVFDTMSLGLVRFPASYLDPPQCICQAVGLGNNYNLCKQLLAPGVSCGVSGLPQIAIAPAGSDKSNAATGVRHDIYQHLVSVPPLSNQDDGSPIYEALAAGYNALELFPGVTRRLLILITDGGFSCTSMANPARPAYQDLNNCPDWEIPDTVNALIKARHDDAAAPINTFVIGVPGSDSTGQKIGGYDTPPYHMKLALSTYAVSGSPESIDAACDSATMYTQGGADPAKPCHIDLSAGGAFDATALSNAITALRGKALGCIYDLPAPPPGETIDPTLVNVDATINGVVTSLPKRSDPNDDCALDGCWDYNASSQVQILGKTCDDIGTAASAKVEIVVGCETIIK